MWIRNEATIGQQRNVLVSVEIAPCTRPINFTNTHTDQLHDATFRENDAGWVAILRRIGGLTDRPHLVAYADALAGTKRAKPKSAAPAIAAVAILALAGGTTAGVFLSPFVLLPAAATSAPPEPVAPAPSPIELVGIWGGGDFKCETLPLRISIESEGLGLLVGQNTAKSIEALTAPAETPGWFETANTAANNFWRREGDVLVWRIGSKDDASRETRLKKCGS
jgi:hypothetical protein